MYLTKEQLVQFDEQGCLVFPGVFNKDEVRRMREEADHILELIVNSSLANKRNSGRLDWSQLADGRPIVRKIQPINDLSLCLTQASQDDRLLGPMRDIMQDEPTLLEEKLTYKEILPEPIEGMTIRKGRHDGFHMHSDWAYYRHNNYPSSVISSAICLDDCSVEAGPLHVWPGTHKSYLEHDMMPAMGFVVKKGLVDPEGGVDLIAPPGSVLTFHSMLIHRSAENNSDHPRRLMIYSHYPKGADMPYDARNGPGRLRESPYEAEYDRLKRLGLFQDAFRAPAYYKEN